MTAVWFPGMWVSLDRISDRASYGDEESDIVCVAIGRFSGDADLSDIFPPKISVKRAAIYATPGWASGSTVGAQSLSRTGSPMATRIFRSPLNASLPCAARMLSTNSTSPGCQDSRMVARAYASFSDLTSSAETEVPSPYAVSNGRVSTPYVSIRISSISGSSDHLFQKAIWLNQT